MRRQYSGDQPNEAKWSIANAGDTGEVLQTAMRLGAKTDLLDEAWWLPSIFIADGGDAAKALGSGRQRPGRHLRRRYRQTVLQRVELLRRGRQGDVRQQGGAVLDGLRRRLRRPIRLGGEPVQEAQPSRRADRGRRGPAGRHRRRSGTSDGCAGRRAGADGASGSTGLRPKASTPTSAAASRRTTTAWAIPGYRPNAAIGPLDQRAVLRHEGGSRRTSGRAEG